MERRLNKKIDSYITTFKSDVRERAIQLGLSENHVTSDLLQYIYDYDRLAFNKEDFQKRKRVKNYVPIHDRCCAKRASNEQCTRRRKDDSVYCGTHMKGIPNGIMEQQLPDVKKKTIWVEEYNGIMYYIDDENVYNTEDIKQNIVNPSIIGTCKKNGNSYEIKLK